MRRIKQLAVLGMTMMMVVMVPGQALADTVPDGYDAETWQKLQDNRLEYEEIPNLVKEYNPSFQMMKAGIAAEANTASANKMISDLRESAEEFEYLYKDAKDSGQEILAKRYQETYKSMKKEANKIEKSLNSGLRSTINSTQKQLVSAIQGLMISYHQALAGREMLGVVVELAQAGYDASKTQFSIGMATETEVQTAEKRLLEAQGKLQEVEDGLTTLRQNLCIMTGWSYDASPEIGPVPEPSLLDIDAMNLGTDATKAISNNYALKAQRDSTQKGTVRNRTIEESEELIKTNLEKLYQEVLQARTAYEAASTAFQSAQLTMDGTDSKYQLGMLGRPEYLMEKMAYQEKKTAYIQASLGLTQAMEAYGWAVEGLAAIQ